jgi:hypothetical protein
MERKLIWRQPGIALTCIWLISFRNVIVSIFTIFRKKYCLIRNKYLALLQYSTQSFQRMVALEEKKFLNATNQAIMCGWKASIEDVRNFTNDVPKVAAEYLFTVNIAKSLSGKILSSDGDPYRIYLEHNAYQFLKDSFPSHKVERSGHPLGKGDRRVGRKIMLPRGFRKGRVDIAVYSTYPQSTNLGEFSPFCAIEIKGFNPQKNSILEDLRRNMEYFKTTASSGSSTIRYSIFAGLFGRSHSIRKELSDTDYQYECIQKRRRSRDTCSNYQGLRISIFVSNVKVSALINMEPLI